MAGEMGPLKNILRDKVPSVILDTVGPDVGILVKTFAKGMTVDIKKVKPQAGVAGDEPDYGYCVFPIGTLDMTLDQVLISRHSNVFSLAHKMLDEISKIEVQMRANR